MAVNEDELKNGMVVNDEVRCTVEIWLTWMIHVKLMRVIVKNLSGQTNHFTFSKKCLA